MMKKRVLVLSLCLLGPLMVFSQAIIHSSNGYHVEVDIKLKSVTVASQCQYNFVFNVEMDYDIQFVGASAPNSLYTLQGYLKCGTINRTFFPLTTSPGKGTTRTSNPVWKESICSVTDPHALECNTIILQIHGPGLASQEIEYVLPGPGSGKAPGPGGPGEILPVELLHFSASGEQDGEVLLQWQTATEINNEAFVVERSVDGIIWNSVGKLSGQGTSATLQNYAYTDRSPGWGWKYYRLRQIDFDGKEQFSAVARVYVGMGGTAPSLTVFPNPAHESIQLVGGQVQEAEDFTLYNGLGQVIRTIPVEASRGTSRISVTVSDLQPGMYFIRGGGQVVRFYKQ